MKSDDAPSRLRVMPSWLLNQAALPAQRLVVEALSRVDARRYHYAVLAALDELGPASQAELGRRSGIDRSDMVALVNEFAANKLVERTPDETDRRRNVVAITPTGRRYLRKLDTLLAKTQDQLLSPLSATERKQLVRLLTRLVDHHASG